MEESKRNWREALGLGLLLAWMYCSFFSCGLIAKISVLRSSERVWVYAGIGMAICAVALIVFRRAVFLISRKASSVAGASLGSVGSLLIWLGFLRDPWDASLSTAGGLLAGAGLTVMATIWCRRLSGFKVSRLEATVPAAFVLAFAIYFVLLSIKGPLFVGMCMLMPAGSMALALRRADISTCPFVEQCACSVRKSAAGHIAPQLKSMAPLLTMHCLFWIQFSSFRVISSPNVVGDRFMHYLVPFSCAAVVAVGMFLLCLRHIRFLNYSLMYRWSAPLMVLGCGIFALGPSDYYDYRIVAYAANFLAMFGTQFTIWVVTPKHVCRAGFNPIVAMAGFAIAEGLGIFLGLALSLPAAGNEESLAGTAVLVTGIAVLAAMVFGFNPDWFSAGRAKNPLFLAKEEGSESSGACDDGARPSGELLNGTLSSTDSEGVLAGQSQGKRSQAIAEGTAPTQPSLSEMFESQARALQREYGLTERETEICALLLAGRSRPYIRDELIISLNTVHAHARNIFAKCGVHSQQELMDLPKSMAENASTRK